MVAAVLALSAGCSNTTDQPDEPTPTPTSPDRTPSSWLSPAPTLKPTKPDIVTDQTKAGARAFVEYYYALVNYGRATGNWKPVKKRSLPGCDGCRDFWEPHPDRFDSNHNINVGPGPGEINWGGDDAIMTFDVSVFPLNVFPEHQGLSFNDHIEIVYQKGHWRIESIEAQDIAPPPMESILPKIRERASKAAENQD